jgi:hypothetical protein
MLRNICKIMSYQKHLLPWTVAINDSQSNLAEQVVEISHTLSLITREEDEPKAETAASDNSQGGRGYGSDRGNGGDRGNGSERGYGSERGGPIHRIVN